MPVFLLTLAAILLAVICILALPLVRPRAQLIANEQKPLNREVFRRQLTELTRDHNDAMLSEQAFQQAKLEVEKSLLENECLQDEVSMDVRPAYRSALLVALALVLASSGLYLYLGTPGAIYPENRQAPEEGSDQIGQMVDQLAARLAKNPNDPKGWAMLARSYKVMHRFNDAENAFSHIPDLLHSDPDLMANHADMLAAENNGNLEGEPLQEVEEALAINPDHPMALMLAGTAAYNRHDVAAARKYWSHLLSVMPADSEDAQPLRDALAKLDGAAAPAVATVGPALTGTVAVTAGLTGKIQAGDTLFVYAQAEQGPPMPLAVSRVPASSLPYSFRLDDSMAMSPQMVLSHFKQVRIKARISHSGQAMPAPGDLLGASPAIASDASNIHIVIDQVMP